MKEGIVAKRYAKGLFDLALESGKIDQLETDAALIDAALRRVPLLLRALEDERIAINRRIATAVEIARALELADFTRNAMLLLLTRKRISILGAVAKDVIALVMSQRRLARASVRVADESLALETKRKIEEVLGDLLKLKVKCDVSVDKQLIGGFVVKIGDMRYDASVAGELERMKERLVSGAEGI